MGRRFLLVVLVAGVALSAVVAASGARADADPTRAQGMVLGSADFPQGANVVLEQFTPSELLPRIAYSSVYTRVFDQVKIGQLQIASLVSTAMNAKSESATEKYMSDLAVALDKKTSRSALIAILKKSLTTELANSKEKLVSAKILRGRPLKIGAPALELVFELHTTNESLEVGEVVVREGKAIEAIEYTTGPPGVPAAEDVALARKVATHLQEASQPPPSNTASPAITGSPQPGQILTATPGTWAGTPPTFVYQWSRCNAAGQSCVPIPNATLTTYTVSVADQGQTLAVVVTATTPSGTVTARTQPTLAITST